MKTRIINFILAVILSGTFFTATAQQKDTIAQTHAFSAKEAVDYALNNAVQVKNALLDIKLQQQTNKGITAAALPHLFASGSINYNPNVAVQTFPNFIAQSTYGVLVKENVKNGSGQPITLPSDNDFGLIQAAFGSKYTLNAGIDLNQILFDGQVFVGLQARKASIKNMELTADVTKEQIKANVYKIYYQLVVGQRQIGTLDANIANYEKLLHDTREIYKNGFAEKLDVDKVQVQLSNLQTQKLKAQNQIDAGIEGLKFLMNMPQQDKLILTDTLSDAEIKANILDENFNYEDRKEVQQLETLMELGKFNVKRYKLSKLPTLSLAGNYSKSAQRQEFDFFKGPYFTSSFIALRLNVPIFDGGERNANIASAKLNLMKMNNNMDQLKASIENDVTQSRINMKSAILTMDTQKKNIELAQQVYNSTKLKYEQGLGSNQEISTAQADLVTAQNNYYSSLYDAIIAKIDFLKAAGKL
jgi:outer membrane protein TolC